MFMKICKNKMALFGFIYIIILIIISIFAPLLAPYEPDLGNILMRRIPPSTEHWLGTDELGRDIFSRLIFGARISLGVGLSMIIGIPIGLFAGYLGGRFDLVIMRIVEVLMAFPRILLAILIVTILGPGLRNMVIAVGVWTIPVFARLVRSKAISLREEEFAKAAEALGNSLLRIVFKHILPNCLGPIFVTATLSIASAILTEAGLSFLGLGVPPGTPSWGLMLSSARKFLRSQPYMATFPGLAIALTVLSFNFLGDALRDILDPKQFKG